MQQRTISSNEITLLPYRLYMKENAIFTGNRWNEYHGSIFK
jgi:hypothetical protein